MQDEQAFDRIEALEDALRVVQAVNANTDDLDRGIVETLFAKESRDLVDQPGIARDPWIRSKSTPIGDAMTRVVRRPSVTYPLSTLASSSSRTLIRKLRRSLSS